MTTIDRVAPTIRPPGRPAGFQRWRQLLFLHWAIAPEAIPLPPGLELDRFDGRAWVGVVPFTMRDVSPWWAPSVPGISNFHELNVRTYVHKDGVPGVWFFSLDAANALAVTIARTRWKLPYHKASMTMRIEGDQCHYRSERRWPGPTPAVFEARYRFGDYVGTAEVDTFEHWLVERYVLFAERDGALYSGQVHHEPYPLHEVELESWSSSMVAACGMPRGDEAPLTHFSPGVDVDVYDLARL